MGLGEGGRICPLAGKEDEGESKWLNNKDSITDTCPGAQFAPAVCRNTMDLKPGSSLVQLCEAAGGGRTWVH